MTPGDVVRVLDDRSFGYAPIGSVDQLVRNWARVRLDEPERWGREHSWFLLSELEVVNIAKWEAATDGRDAA